MYSEKQLLSYKGLLSVESFWYLLDVFESFRNKKGFENFLSQSAMNGFAVVWLTFSTSIL